MSGLRSKGFVSVGFGDSGLAGPISCHPKQRVLPSSCGFMLRGLITWSQLPDFTINGSFVARLGTLHRRRRMVHWSWVVYLQGSSARHLSFQRLTEIYRLLT